MIRLVINEDTLPDSVYADYAYANCLVKMCEG